MRESSKRVCAVLLVLAAAFAAAAFFGFFRGTRLQVLLSPDSSHQAELYRLDPFVDRNYLVYVDGHKVYGSPDFAATYKFPYREALYWDASGRIVVLEVARHRIFGYDAVARRRLTDAELLAVEERPDPSLWDYGFESEWPGIGRADRPQSARRARLPKSQDPPARE